MAEIIDLHNYKFKPMTILMRKLKVLKKYAEDYAEDEKKIEIIEIHKNKKENKK